MKAKLVIVFLALLMILVACNSGDLLKVIKQLETPWNSTTVYNAGDYTSEQGKGYKSLQNDNVGHEPVASPSWWSAT